jgi:hypothetical protein
MIHPDDQHSAESMHTATATANARRAADEPSIGSLFKELTDETRTLLRKEVELAKAEMSEKAAFFGRNAAYLGIGAMVAYSGALVLLAAACIGLGVALARVMDPRLAAWLSPLIIGLVLVIVGYALVQKAISTMRHHSLAPEKTMNSLRENSQWLKNKVT